MSALPQVQVPPPSLRDTSPASGARKSNACEQAWVREARLTAHIEKRLMSCDWLLAQAHGRAAAWYGGADRLTLLAVQVAAMDKVHELSIWLLKGRVWVLREWRGALADGDSALAVGLMTDCLSGDIPCLPASMMPYAAADRAALRHAEVNEANLALGVWDGPEEIFKLMEGDRNVA